MYRGAGWGRLGLIAAAACGLVATSAELGHAVPLARGFKQFTTVVEPAKAPKGWIQFCRDHPYECDVDLIDSEVPTLTDERAAELQQVNSTVNRQIKPKTDLANYGTSEKWTYPDNGYGDCEDYVLLKRRKLIELGWPIGSLFITIVWNKNLGHSVLTVRTDRGEFVLDNLQDKVQIWSKTGYDFVKRQSDGDVNAWVYIDGDHYRPAVVSSRPAAGHASRAN